MNALGATTSRTYVRIKKGAVVITINQSDKDKYNGLIQVAHHLDEYLNTKNVPKIDICFSYIVGRLIGIDYKIGKVPGQDIEQKEWTIILYNDDDGKEYVISTPWDSSVVFNLLNCLVTIPQGRFATIKIQPYLKDESTRLVVYNGEEKLSWGFQPDQIPPLEKIILQDGSEYIDPKTRKPKLDYTKRINFFSQVAKDINAKLGYVTQAMRERTNNAQQQNGVQSQNGYKPQYVNSQTPPVSQPGVGNDSFTQQQHYYQPTPDDNIPEYSAIDEPVF